MREFTVSDYEKFRAYIASEAWVRQAALLDDGAYRPGRRRQFKAHVLLLFFYGTTFVWQTARKTATQLADRDHWEVLSRIVRDLWPHRPDLWLPSSSPRRHHYLYFRRRVMEPRLAELLDLHEEMGVQLATRLGLCDPSGPGSWNHPHNTRTLTADAKVVTTLFRSKKPHRARRHTGEIVPVRHDPDARLHTTGDGRMVYGNKFEVLHVRGDQPHARVILSVRYVGAGGEAPVLLKMLDRLVPRLPGVQALVYDGALRGVHLNQIMARNGIMPVVPSHGAKAERVPAPRHLTYFQGEQLFTHLGALGIGHLTERGEVAFERLKRRNILRREKADGTFRWYAEFEMPSGQAVRQRLDQTVSDTLRDINRAEHLRAFARGDDDYQRIMGLRSDSESLNRGLEDTLFIGRAHSVGKLRQLLDMVGFATGVNAVAVYLTTRPDPPPDPAAF